MPASALLLAWEWLCLMEGERAVIVRPSRARAGGRDGSDADGDESDVAGADAARVSEQDESRRQGKKERKNK